MVLLYASRACYNLAALALAPRSRLDAFDYDWYHVSDQVGIQHVCYFSSHAAWLVFFWHNRRLVQVPAFPQADLVNDLGNKGYLVFGLILFVWELLPTTLLVGFFRVHRPPQDLVGPPPCSMGLVEKDRPWEWDLGTFGGGKHQWQ
jgi:hypothetical protein